MLLDRVIEYLLNLSKTEELNELLTLSKCWEIEHVFVRKMSLNLTAKSQITAQSAFL